MTLQHAAEQYVHANKTLTRYIDTQKGEIEWTVDGVNIECRNTKDLLEEARRAVIYAAKMQDKLLAKEWRAARAALRDAAEARAKMLIRIATT